MAEVTFKYTARILGDGVGVIEERSNITDRIVETRINARDEATARVLEDMGWVSPNRCAQLVDALEQILGWRELRSGREFPIERIEDIARAALAAHRKGDQS